MPLRDQQAKALDRGPCSAGVSSFPLNGASGQAWSCRADHGDGPSDLVGDPVNPAVAKLRISSERQHLALGTRNSGELLAGVKQAATISHVVVFGVDTRSQQAERHFLHPWDSARDKHLVRLDLEPAGHLELCAVSQVADQAPGVYDPLYRPARSGSPRRTRRPRQARPTLIWHLLPRVSTRSKQASRLQDNLSRSPERLGLFSQDQCRPTRSRLFSYTLQTRSKTFTTEIRCMHTLSVHDDLRSL